MKLGPTETDTLNLSLLYRQWYPLALSRIVINAEAFLVTVFLARMPSPLLALAAFGGLVYPIMFLIESPTWMFLSTSTALAKSRRDFTTLLRFAQVFALLLSLPMMLLVLSPFYETVLYAVLGADTKLVSFSRLAFLVATPWVFLTADRRVYQGTLIRAGHSKALLYGTFIRLVLMLAVLVAASAIGGVNGAVWGAASITVGLLTECLYVRWVFSKVSISSDWEEEPEQALSNRAIRNYYVPLALDGFVWILRRPLGSAAMLRLPFATESLAIVGAVYSFVQCFVAISISLLEVVVTYAEQVERRALLWKFNLTIALSLAIALLLIVSTPLKYFVLSTVLGLSDALIPASAEVLLIFSPIPVLLSLHVYFEAMAMVQHRTKYIIQATVAGLLFFCLMIGVLALATSLTGAHVFAIALSTSVTLNVFFLRSRVRSAS